MNTVLRPVGPEPARVYWTRRIMLLLALVVAATLVWTLVQGSGSSSEANAPGGKGAAGAPGADDDASDDAGEDPAGGGAAAPCTAENLELAIEPGRAGYAADAQPSFVVTVTNTGDSGCTVDVGDASRELLVTSGSDRIWSSLDCAAGEGASRNLLLAAGMSDAHDASWPRVRSDESCSDALPKPRPGTYKAQVRLNGAESELATFSLE